MEEYRRLADVAIQRLNFDIAIKCLIKLSDWRFLNIIDSYQKSESKNDALFLARYYVDKGHFSEAGKLLKKRNMEGLAVDMFSELQMYEQAKEYRSLATTGTGQAATNSNGPSGFTKSDLAESSSSNNVGAVPQNALNDIKSITELYVSKNELTKASELLSKTSVDKYGFVLSR